MNTIQAQSFDEFVVDKRAQTKAIKNNKTGEIIDQVHLYEFYDEILNPFTACDLRHDRTDLAKQTSFNFLDLDKLERRHFVIYRMIDSLTLKARKSGVCTNKISPMELEIGNYFLLIEGVSYMIPFRVSQTGTTYFKKVQLNQKR